MPAHSIDTPLRIVVLLSGSGTNLQAILDSLNKDNTPAKVVAVISNKADAFGLERARKEGITAEVVSHRDFPDRQAYDQALMQQIDQFKPELVVLAGFMRILTDPFVNHYYGRMMNIHPSLLPKYKGLNTHQRALDAGDNEHGCTVHFVTPELDGGPLILQAKVRIEKEDSADSLAQRVHQQEYIIYPLAIEWFAHDRLRLDKDTVLFDGQPISTQQSRLATRQQGL